MRRGFFCIILIFSVAVACGMITSCNGIGALADDKTVFASDGDGNAVLISVQGYYGKDAVIPRVSPKGEPVVGVGAEAFAGCGATSVTLPEGVRFIDSRAFANCRGITAFHIPDSVTELGTRVFEGCVALETLTVGNGNPRFRSEKNCIIERESGALIYGCGGSVIPDGVTSISGGAFYGAVGLSAADIPEGVVSIGGYAFYGCSGIEEIHLPDSLESIGNYAFAGCSALTKIAVSPRITALSEGLFRNCASLITVELPNELTLIGRLAFQGCASLVDPEFPDSLTEIGGLAFSGCNAFIHLKIPKNVTVIGDGAFSYCDMLWGIKVDSQNTVYKAKGNCLIRREDGAIVLGTRGSIIPSDESVTAIADRAFFGAKFLRNTVIPRNIRTVGREAFYGCDYLETVAVLGAATVGDMAFVNCFTLRTVFISDSVEHMGNSVFEGCVALDEIRMAFAHIPDSWNTEWNGSGADILFDCEYNEAESEE